MAKLNPVQRALAKFDGSPTKMAAALGNGVLRQHIEHWRESGRVPTEHCRAVHDLTDVKCWELRPADWSRIWPDLIGTKGAPKVMPQGVDTPKAKAGPNSDAAHAAATNERRTRPDRRQGPRRDSERNAPSPSRESRPSNRTSR
jgi:hypothetical protein